MDLVNRNQNNWSINILGPDQLIRSSESLDIYIIVHLFDGFLIIFSFAVISSPPKVRTLREKCPYSEFFWSVFSRIWTEYGEILHSSPCFFRIWENTDSKKSEYGHFSRSGKVSSEFNLLCSEDIFSQLVERAQQLEFNLQLS